MQNINHLEKSLWEAADQLRANSSLTVQEQYLLTEKGRRLLKELARKK